MSLLFGFLSSNWRHFKLFIETKLHKGVVIGVGSPGVRKLDYIAKFFTLPDRRVFLEAALRTFCAVATVVTMLFLALFWLGPPIFSQK